ncbi:MAG: hypothetical protein PHY04_01400 [Candidatus ainarchaeum sp.]|jgi:hypothetical protein|nr:hypothetical protein [Candidatus ainarchaeum sp.]MDD3086123.1 hypothetical protein [Candidatus ainarchaeum sp.]MDD4128371.1 hypothetical protein [Candidatus ainarchaeum sp.]
MELVKKIFSFFSKSFKPEPQILKTDLETLPSLLEKSFVVKKVELEENAAKKITEIKYLHSKTLSLIKRLNDTPLEEKTNTRLNHAVETSKKQLLIQLERMLGKINPIDIKNNINSYREYSKKSESLLIGEINSFRKNIAYTSFYHQDEMKELGEFLQNILNNLHELNQKFDYNKEIFEFENFKEKIGSSIQRKKELKQIQREINALSEKIIKKQEELKKYEDKIDSNKSNPKFLEIIQAEKELSELTNEKQDLKLQISALLLNIDRPLQRYKQLLESGRKKGSKEEKETINLFITNPLLALKKDPKAIMFKKILKDIRESILEGEIDLKEKEKEKRLEALDEIIKYDFFGTVFWKMNELQKKQIELNKSISSNPIKKDIEEENKNLKEMDSELKELVKKTEELDKQKQVIQRTISNEIDSARNFAQNNLKQTIILEEEIS